MAIILVIGGRTRARCGGIRQTKFHICQLSVASGQLSAKFTDVVHTRISDRELQGKTGGWGSNVRGEDTESGTESGLVQMRVTAQGGPGRRTQVDAPGSEARAGGSLSGLDPGHPQFVTRHGLTLNEAQDPGENWSVRDRISLFKGKGLRSERFFRRPAGPAVVGAPMMWLCAPLLAAAMMAQAQATRLVSFEPRLRSFPACP